MGSLAVQELAGFQREAPAKKMVEEEKNKRYGPLLAQLPGSIHEGFPIGMIPAVNDAFDIHQPDQSIYTMLQCMKAQIYDLIVWAKTPGLQTFNVYDSGVANNIRFGLIDE